MSVPGIKKDFQKTIRAVRKSLEDGEYIQPFMSEPQMRTGTGTINCRVGENAGALAEKILAHPEIEEFLTRTGTTAALEQGRYGEQIIRLSYAPAMSGDSQEPTQSTHESTDGPSM